MLPSAAQTQENAQNLDQYLVCNTLWVARKNPGQHTYTVKQNRLTCVRATHNTTTTTTTTTQTYSTERQRATKQNSRAPKRTYLVASAGSSWLVSDSDTRSIELSASPVPSPAACKYSTVPRAALCSSLVRRLCLATASMWGERSTPVMRRAKGKVCASLRVDSPVEQPMSRMSFGSGPLTLVSTRAIVRAFPRLDSTYSSGCFHPRVSLSEQQPVPIPTVSFFSAALQSVRDQTVHLHNSTIMPFQRRRQAQP